MLGVENVMTENTVDYSDFFLCIAHSKSTNNCTILYCMLYILTLISSYMFQHNHHHQGAYTNAVKSYSNKTVL